MSNFFNSIAGWGILIGAIAYAYRAWKSGGNDFDKQAITNLQAAIAGLSKENELLKEENTRLRDELKEQMHLQSKMAGDMKVLQALAQGQPAIDGFAKTFDTAIENIKSDIVDLKKGQDRIIDILMKK